MINRLKTVFPELNDVSFELLDDQTSAISSKTIYQIQTPRPRGFVRVGCEVDKTPIELVLKKFTNCQQIPFITALDYQSDNTINMPLGFVCFKRIKQQPDYYIQYNKNIKYYGNLFWRGDATTHEIRKKIVDALNINRPNNFDIAHWKPSAGQFYQNACTENEYDTYFDRLKQSDAFLIMRGDRPWTFSFFDCLRANVIPVCIDTFYHKLGWHKIGFDIEDLFLVFNTQKDSAETIANEIQNLLKDKERVLFMKNNLLKFYTQFVMQDKYLLTHGPSVASAGWGYIIRSKLLDIHNNDYILKDNYLF
jgi:hypothetical protein